MIHLESVKGHLRIFLLGEVNPPPEQAAEKLKFLSFRGTLRAEESLILLNLKPGEIPRFARNVKIIYFFRNL